jgi:hypothetical protein
MPTTRPAKPCPFDNGCGQGVLSGVHMGWLEDREAMRWEIRELIHHADKCLDDFDGSPLLPLSVLSMSKALEFASRNASRLAEVYLSESIKRSQNSTP